MQDLVCGDCGNEFKGNFSGSVLCPRCSSTRITTVSFAEDHFGSDWREKCFGKKTADTSAINMAPLHRQIAEFAASRFHADTLERSSIILPRAAEFSNGFLCTYLRAGSDPYNKWVGKYLAIARISVDESVRRRGLFKEFLEFLTGVGRSIGYDALYVEQVHNPHLHKYLLSVGFVDIEREGDIVMKRVL